MNTPKFFILCAAALAGLSVVLGAFGAHALKAKLTPDQLQVFETGVRYQMFHAIALFVVAWLIDKTYSVQAAGWFFIVGIFFFSGSLYLLANRELLHIETWKWLGPITPLGGLSFIIGWFILFVSVLKK